MFEMTENKAPKKQADSKRQLDVIKRFIDKMVVSIPEKDEEPPEWLQTLKGQVDELSSLDPKKDAKAVEAFLKKLKKGA